MTDYSKDDEALLSRGIEAQNEELAAAKARIAELERQKSAARRMVSQALRAKASAEEELEVHCVLLAKSGERELDQRAKIAELERQNFDVINKLADAVRGKADAEKALAAVADRTASDTGRSCANCGHGPNEGRVVPCDWCSHNYTDRWVEKRKEAHE